MLAKLRTALDQVPAGALPPWAQAQLARVGKEIDEFLARRFYKPNPKHELPTAPGRRGTRLDLSADEAYQLLNDAERCVEVIGKKQFVAVKNGRIYVYMPDNLGSFHAFPSVGNEVYTNYPSVAAKVAHLLGVDVKRLSRMLD